MSWTEWVTLLNHQLARPDCPVPGVSLRVSAEQDRPAGLDYDRTPQNDAAVSWALDRLREQGFSTAGW